MLPSIFVSLTLLVPAWQNPPIPSDQAVLKIQTPEGAIVFIDGKNMGNRGKYVYKGFSKNQFREFDVMVQLPGGRTIKRQITLLAGHSTVMSAASLGVRNPKSFVKMDEGAKLFSKGKILLNQGRFHEALSIATKARDVNAKSRGKIHVSTMFCQSLMARAHAGLGQYEKSKEILLEMAKALKDTKDKDLKGLLSIVEKDLIDINRVQKTKSARPTPDRPWIEKVPADKAVLEIDAPEGATIYIDGKPNGKKRRYVYSGLAKDAVFSLNVDVIMPNGFRSRGNVTLAAGMKVVVSRVRLLSKPELEKYRQARRVEDEAFAARKRGDYRTAITQSKKVVKMMEEVLGKNHITTADCYNNLGTVLGSQGDFSGARSYCEEALSIRLEILGEKHPIIANSYNNLGGILSYQGDFKKAEEYYKKSLEIILELQGEKNSGAVDIYNNLGGLQREQGEYAEARKNYEKSLALRIESKGEKHHLTASCYNNLGIVIAAQGDYKTAKKMLEKSLAIRQEVLGKNHPETAIGYNSLGNLIFRLGDYDAAKELLEKAMSIHLEILGEKHPSTATGYNNLGQLHVYKREYEEARKYFEKSLAISVEIFGEKHPQTALSYSTLADAHAFQGDFKKAKKYYEKAVSIRLAFLGEKHPDTALVYRKLGNLLDSYGESVEAATWSKKAITIVAEHFQQNMVSLGENEKVMYLRSQRTSLDQYLSFARRAESSPAIASDFVFAWKGQVQESQQKVRNIVSQSPKAKQLWSQYQSVLRQLSVQSRLAPSPRKIEVWRANLERLNQERNKIEGELSTISATFLKEKQARRLTPLQLQKHLPPNAVVIDFLEYEYSTASKTRQGRFDYETHLVAFLIPQQGEIKRVDFGPVENIYKATNALLELISKKKGAPGHDNELVFDGKKESPQSYLKEKVWDPIRRHLGESNLILISPDGVAGRIPFAVLPGDKPNTYLIEDYSLAVLPIPRRLPMMLDTKRQPSTRGLLVYGGIDYDDEPGEPNASEFPLAHLSRDADLTNKKRGETKVFEFLIGTRQEAASIKKLYQTTHNSNDALVLTNSDATEQSFREKAPTARFLHIATHGYFAPYRFRKAARDLTGFNFGDDKVLAVNPALQSGLAFTGANKQVRPGHDDGILTALEVASNDLRAVDLAVLSACETALGKSERGEGIVGLQRAFQIAGVRTTITSLIKVDDNATRELMIEFYKNLWDRKMGKLEALRAAQLTMMKKYNPVSGQLDRAMKFHKDPHNNKSPAGAQIVDGRLPPYYWGMFVLAGDWGGKETPTPPSSK